MNKLYNFENKIVNSHYKFKYISDKINYLFIMVMLLKLINLFILIKLMYPN
jgi:hypothetical protein